ncbi:hypothetical protein UMM65_15925 [Aureibaculum sp. 2210JD6-5]|uniref:hypothetical protein n=1 Tax=Aureibaculum sp. 2210JD6-5 TaxID=3103957 RepID=UPI002AAD8226|nr:hypothetical protein [Aureibaculum sp. 2210JD6-5]MDY7396737.1 hypothetical protein [Aureibaculum sp. 2210JD6-5]
MENVIGILSKINAMKFEKLLQKLDTQLSKIKDEHSEIIDQANFSIITCKDILSQMNHLVQKNGFKNEDEEIHFFKKVKIHPLSKLVYFIEIHSLELKFQRFPLVIKRGTLKLKSKKSTNFMMIILILFSM